MKRIISLLSLLCCIIYASASMKCVTVEMNNGEKFDFLLETFPTFTFNDGNLVINNNEAYSYSIGEVRNYHFSSGESTGIGSIGAKDLQIVTIDDETLEVRNASAHLDVQLSTINGAIISITSTDTEGTATIKLPNEKGVYVLTIGNKAFKFIRK